ncbi:tRNA (mo5U34)-methyltransferase [Hasllibacter halocynthiae]|uniref:tRNA (Mo5U34)-methyltransferase n=1 Tax=Hasllibacter halocynthiae TaxID=595589 RepID=A0A2T0X940_9RHOB|nr:TIGR04290 family methyltransferase [Hasllibacter halocynthiae]PRY95462.1 tRNA (mo5U34)-methyltransferase [Hasllibacter halocynthiae]
MKDAIDVPATDDPAALGPWFHNLHLPGGVQTAPDHRFGDFPRFKWLEIAPHLPADLSGWRALDIGCNAGFYSFELARRGAEVTGIDLDPHYLRQAAWAAGRMGLPVTFRRQQVYDLARSGERFDLVLFMGVFYHLRYPLLALDALARVEPRLMVFQTLTADTGEGGEAPAPPFDFEERDRLTRRDHPFMAFIEGRFADDPTNWWAPNHAGICAMLRSAGFRIEARPGHEIYLCRRDPAAAVWPAEEGEFRSAAGLPATHRTHASEKE